jgi:hypothetical protein
METLSFTNEVRKSLRSLREFGLNPDEWVIEDIKNQQFELFHIEDPSFKLKGEFDNSGWKWLEFSNLDF